MTSIVALTSLLLLSMMMFRTEGYEVGRPRRRSLVKVNLLTPEERKTPLFQEDFFRGLKEINSYSYSYSYSNTQKTPLQPCNLTEVGNKNVTLDLPPANETEVSSSKKQAILLNATSDSVIQVGSSVIAEESLARSSVATKELVTKPATSTIAIASGVGVALLLVASVSVFFAHRRWKKNINEGDAVV